MSFVKKFLGLVLLFGGLLIILYGIYSSYNIFTAKETPPEIFKEEGKIIFQKGGSQDIQEQLQGLLQEQLKGILPVGSVPALMNLFSWSIFAGILILGGGQMAGLGIKLLK